MFIDELISDNFSRTVGEFSCGCGGYAGLYNYLEGFLFVKCIGNIFYGCLFCIFCVWNVKMLINKKIKELVSQANDQGNLFSVEGI